MAEDLKDSLQLVPMEEWGDVEKILKEDWPRGVPAYNMLLTQREIKEMGLDYGFKLYSPHGDAMNGIVALNKKAGSYEILIHCPNDDTKQLEEALKTTKVINWKTPILLPYLSDRILPLCHRVAENYGLGRESLDVWFTTFMVFSKKNPLFENISLPEDVKFQPILEKDVGLIDSLWSVRYYTSKWSIKLHIKRNASYALYKNDEILAWVMINELGALTHLYTLEKHRKHGYAKLLLQLLCNKRIKEKCDVVCPVVRRNENAIKLYLGLGFEKLHPVEWLFLYP